MGLQSVARSRPPPSNDPKILATLPGLHSQGITPEAQNSSQRVLEAKPDSAQSNGARLFLAMTALDREDVDLRRLAQPEVERILSATPNYVPALMVRACGAARRMDAAIATYSELLRRFPVYSRAKGVALFTSEPRQTRGSLQPGRQARKAPDDPELAQILAEASYEKKEFAYAIQLLQQSASEKPLDAKQLYILGMSHFNAKDKRRSREALDKALDSGLPEPLAADAKRTISKLGTLKQTMMRCLSRSY